MAIDEMKLPTEWDAIKTLQEITEIQGKRIKKLEEDAKMHNRIFNKRLIEIENPD